MPRNAGLNLQLTEKGTFLREATDKWEKGMEKLEVGLVANIAAVPLYLPLGQSATIRLCLLFFLLVARASSSATSNLFHEYFCPRTRLAPSCGSQRPLFARFQRKLNNFTLQTLSFEAPISNAIDLYQRPLSLNFYFCSSSISLGFSSYSLDYFFVSTFERCR